MIHNLRIAAFLPRSRVNGPGLRAVLWVQGCPRHCPGCFNPDFLPFDGGREQSPEDVLARIAGDPDVEGVTISGGEPFSQAGALARLALGLKATGRSVVVFTGHEWPALRASADPDRRALLAAVDVLIAGPYRRDLVGTAPSHPLLSSPNQELVLLSDRYRREDFGAAGGRRREFHIARDGSMTVTGFPHPAGVPLARPSVEEL